MPRFSKKFDHLFSHVFIFGNMFPESHGFVAMPATRSNIFVALHDIIIYHDFLPTPRRGSHVKSGKTHTQSSRYTP